MSRFDEQDDLAEPSVTPAAKPQRIPQWMIDERLGIKSTPQAHRSWTPPEEKKGLRKRVPIIAGICLLAIFGSYSYAQYSGVLNGIPVLGDLVIENGSSVPRPGHEEASAPLGTPAPVITANSSWKPIDTTDDGTPITWDPCRPIHYVVRAENSPANGDAILASSIATVSAATGLQFINDGYTGEAPSDDRKIFQPENYGNRWAPVLITWATADEVPDLAGSVAGQAGPQQVSYDDERAYVSGQVILDAQQLGEMDGAGATADVQRVVEHEMGHLVGLDHVNDRSQLMYPETSAQTHNFADGDLTGLAAMGSGACTPKL